MWMYQLREILTGDLSEVNTGKNKGKSYVTITDQKSNEEVVVEVNITDPAVAPGTPAEAVDLGLPSGTKWATFNVGAVKPADFGGFYA